VEADSALSRGRREVSERRGETMRGQTTVIGLLACAVLALTASPASAKDGDVLRAGKCTGGITSKIKLSEENGRIEVEFEVDQNRNGVRWTISLTRNGARFARLVRTTRPPSGSFEARALARNGAGAEVIRGRAVSPSGAVCTAQASWR
jgi:hypothetical protein